MTFTYDLLDSPRAALPVPAAENTRSLVQRVLEYAQRLRAPALHRELPDFTRLLATLLQSGTNTPEALESLRGDIQSRELRRAVEALEIATKRGLPLYAAMRRQPRIFDRVYTEIVAAGER